MASEALENLVGGAHQSWKQGVQSVYNTIDIYANGLSQMYLGPMDMFPPIGADFGLPGPWETPGSYGIGGPGEARAIYPGLVERARVDLDGHGSYGPHINLETYSIFNGMNMPISNEHINLF